MNSDIGPDMIGNRTNNCLPAGMGATQCIVSINRSRKVPTNHDPGKSAVVDWVIHHLKLPSQPISSKDGSQCRLLILCKGNLTGSLLQKQSTGSCASGTNLAQ